MTIAQLQEVKNRLINFEKKTKSCLRISYDETKELLESLETHVSRLFRVAQCNIQTFQKANEDKLAASIRQSLDEIEDVYQRVHQWCVTDVMAQIDHKVKRFCQTATKKFDPQEIRTISKNIAILHRHSSFKSHKQRLEELKHQLEKIDQYPPSHPVPTQNSPSPIPLGDGICALPLELMEHIFSYCTDVFSLRRVNHQFKQAADGHITHCWLELKHSPPQGSVFIRPLMEKTENQLPNQPCLHLFKVFKKEFANHGATPDNSLSLLRRDFEVLQRQATKHAYLCRGI